MGNLKADLQAQGLQLVETHISWVFLGSEEVYKVKRPVDLGFVDFTTREKRRLACEAEVRLNARLAPGIYLGVVPVVKDAEGVHVLGAEGRPVDWAVRMRRLPDEQRADVLLGAGSLGCEEIDRVAAHIADFHDRARSDATTARHGRVDVIRANVEENFEQTRGSIHEFLEPAQAQEVEAWQLARLEDQATFEARISSNKVRDGHGDLRLEHVYFREDRSIVVIDCIEFNDRFRYADVCSDIAFLSMDLTWHGRPDLAEYLLARYAWETDDYDLYSVVDFYESYRAFVRGKVASLLALDGEASSVARGRAYDEARRYFLLSVAFERPPLEPPRIIAVGGQIASGKSTVASSIAQRIAAPLLSSDRTRKRLAGREPTESMKSEAWSEHYSEAATEDVYEELLRRAELIVRSGRPVVVDASFRTVSMRRRFHEAADRLGVPFLLVECHAERSARLERLRARERAMNHESDARSDLLDTFEAAYEPPEELPARAHERIDTSKNRGSTRRRLDRLFPPRAASGPDGEDGHRGIA